MNSKGVIFAAVLCALVCLNGVSAGLGTGGCPKSRQAMKNFDLSRYTGRWFETGSFGAFFEANGKCIQANYKQLEEVVGVTNVMIDANTLQTKYIRGWAKPADNSGDGKLAVTFPIGDNNRTAPYWVLDTDYENYSVVYSCVNFILFHYDFGWILSRQAELNENIRSRVDEVILSNGLTPQQFTPQVQDCGILEVE